VGRLRDYGGVKLMLRSLFAIALTFAVAACSKPDERPREDATKSSGAHEHKAPHGGTPVVLGKEAYHLELVRDAVSGTLSAYVLDGEMEKFIRVPALLFEIVANVRGEKRPLQFKAVASSVTGETVGDTAQFDAQADWLKTTSSFDAVLTSLEIRGSRFENVAFNFPKGNDKD
jgi:hypothetical protein